MSETTFSEWFCLKNGKKNFNIDPLEDQDKLFGAQEWQTSINDRLKKAAILGLPVRVVWWGQYGIGKTHRLRFTDNLIHKHEYSYYPCYVVASDIQEKTNFDRLHFELVSNLGMDTMRKLVKSYCLKVATKTQGVRPLGEISGSSEDVKVALESFGGNSDRICGPAWRFLCGRKLEKGEIDSVGVSRASLERAMDYVGVLSALATIIETETGKQLFYLIDEVENLLRITNKVAEARWTEALRAMLDIKNLSVAFAVGADKTDQLPTLILRPEIVRRIVKDNIVQMSAYNTPETNKFVLQLLEQWIDGDGIDDLEKSEGLDQNKEYSRESYPFTKTGMKMFCENMTIDPRNAKPSVILSKLNGIAAEAFLSERRLIDRELLTEMGYA